MDKSNFKLFASYWRIFSFFMKIDCALCLLGEAATLRTVDAASLQQL
jgi:hypothetical protein